MKKLLLSILCVLCCLGLVACGRDARETTESKNFKIVTSFYPVYIQTLNITKGIDGVVIETLASKEGGDVHDFQLSPSDMKKIESANVLVINGGGMESFLDKVKEENKDLKVIDSSTGIEFIKDEHGINPHVWLNVKNAQIQVENIAENLAKLDPKNGDKYLANAKEYIEKLKNLEQELAAKINPLPNKQIVTFHEAFPYFAKEFNLDIVGVIEVEPGDTPSPKEIEAIAKIVNSMPHKVIFTEPGFAPESAKTIANETGATIYELNPAETGPDNYDAYIDIMKKNGDILYKALK